MLIENLIIHKIIIQNKDKERHFQAKKKVNKPEEFITSRDNRINTKGVSLEIRIIVLDETTVM